MSELPLPVIFDDLLAKKFELDRSHCELVHEHARPFVRPLPL